MDTIMGQDVNTLLKITDNMKQGRITFFTAICILFGCYALYNLSIIIWSIKKEEYLIELKQELYRVFKKRSKESKQTGMEKMHAPTNKKSVEIKDKSSNPSEKEIEKAMESIEYFHRKRHL